MSNDTSLTAAEIASAERSANWDKISALIEDMDPTSSASIAYRREAAAKARKLLPNATTAGKPA